MCDCDGVVLPVGPAGAAGTNGTNGTNGLSAFTLTTAAFTVPAISANVTIAVSNTGQYTGVWAGVGEEIFIVGAGYYRVVSATATSIVATNTGTTGNAAAATVIALGAGVSPGGRQGVAGVAIIDTDVTINNTTSGSYATVKSVTVVGGSIGAVDDMLTLEADIIGDSTATSVPYSIKVEFDGNIMLEMVGLINGGTTQGNAAKLAIDLVVSAADTITPRITWQPHTGVRTLQLLYAGGINWSYVDAAAAASIALASNRVITVQLKSDGTNNIALTYFTLTKKLKV
jgi:hypothetical protein